MQWFNSTQMTISITMHVDRRLTTSAAKRTFTLLFSHGSAIQTRTKCIQIQLIQCAQKSPMLCRRTKLVKVTPQQTIINCNIPHQQREVLVRCELFKSHHHCIFVHNVLQWSSQQYSPRNYPNSATVYHLHLSFTLKFIPNKWWTETKTFIKTI